MMANKPKYRGEITFGEVVQAVPVAHNNQSLAPYRQLLRMSIALREAGDPNHAIRTDVPTEALSTVRSRLNLAAAELKVGLSLTSEPSERPGRTTIHLSTGPRRTRTRKGAGTDEMPANSTPDEAVPATVKPVETVAHNIVPPLHRSSYGGIVSR